MAKIYNLNTEIEPLKTLELSEKLRNLSTILKDFPGELIFNLIPNENGESEKNFQKNSVEFLPRLTKEKTLMHVDYDLNVISEEELTENIDEELAKKISKENESLTILISPPEITFYCCGVLVEYLPNFNRNFVSRWPINFEPKPMERYNELLLEHYETEVKFAQVCDHWSKKSERILRNKPESIFRKILWNFLKVHVNNLISCDPEYDVGTGDTVDIRVLTSGAKEYLIELKCLGKCRRLESKEVTSYTDAWARKGARQTIEYLNIRTDAEKGLCVIYDGRDKNGGSYEEILWDTKEKHPKLNHFQFYLESKPASERAN
ncbi:hypothetical protein GOV13_05170 [Candidatus Pacearchaeota archaeon]|nr:hypothetical protein [Candidatus Pacearchaeota archaeon]